MSVYSKPHQGEQEDSFSEHESEIPDEDCKQVDLNTIYAYNGYYGRSKDKRDMLEKNVYYENFVDVVDEQLCAVASKISEKKALEK